MPRREVGLPTPTDASSAQDSVAHASASVAALPPSNPVAESLRGFGPIGVLAILIVALSGAIFVGDFGLPLGAALVVAWARLSETPLAAVGFIRPRSWLITILAGVALGVVLKLVMKALVMPLFGAPPVNAAYSYLTGNTAALPGAIWTMIVVAGLGEETVFRGFLFERMRTLLGNRAGTALAILASAAIFGAAHFSTQGANGVQQATIVGLVYGGVYAFTRSLWLPILAHAAFDLTALALIYWDLESTVASLLFQ